VRRFLRRVFGKELEGIRRLFGFLRKRSAPPSAVLKKRNTPSQDDPGGRPTVRQRPPAAKMAAQSPRRRPPPKSPSRSRPAPSGTPKSAASGPGKAHISADRVGPLDREIAHSPADPFTSVVASVVFHLLLLLLLVPLLIPKAPEPPKTWSVVVTIEPKKTKPVIDPLPTPVEQPDPPPITKAEPVEEQTLAADTEALAEPPASEFGMPQGAEGSRRSGAARQRALAHQGGNGATERAVKAGLDWLLRHQDSDGSWSPDQFHKNCSDRVSPCSGAGYREHRAGITALSLLALLGDGHLPRQDHDPLDDATHRALHWLLQHQDPSGCIRTDPSSGTRNLYDHGIATFALCEAAQWTSDPEIDGAARLALSFLGASQQAGGGWDYTPAISLRNDLSITGWQMLAIHAGIEAGILPSRETIASIERYLQRAIDRRAERPTRIGVAAEVARESESMRWACSRCWRWATLPYLNVASSVLAASPTILLDRSYENSGTSTLNRCTTGTPQHWRCFMSVENPGNGGTSSCNGWSCRFSTTPPMPPDQIPQDHGIPIQTGSERPAEGSPRPLSEC